MLYSFPNLEPVYCSMSDSNGCFLTCIPVSQEACKVVWYSHLFKNFPQFFLIYIVSGFGIISKEEEEISLEFSFWLSAIIKWMLNERHKKYSSGESWRFSKGNIQHSGDHSSFYLSSIFITKTWVAPNSTFPWSSG